MAAEKTSHRMPIGSAALEVQVAAALTLLRGLLLEVLEHQGRGMLAVLVLVGRLGLAAAAGELLLLVQITQPQKQVVLAVLVLQIVSLAQVLPMLVAVAAAAALLLAVLVVLVVAVEALFWAGLTQLLELQILAEVVVAQEMPTAATAAPVS